MVNVFLIIIGIVMIAALVAANLYILVYFQHVEDKNTAIFPKIVVVAGLTLTFINILMLPYDVANARTDGGLPMEYIWMVLYVIIAVFAVGVIPFTIFYYEAETPNGSNWSQIKSAIKWEVVIVFMFIVLTVILWLVIGIAEVPAERLNSGLISGNAPLGTACPNCSVSSTNVNYRVSFVLYLISMLTFLGLFLFVLFGSIGLAALPMDLINGFRFRPRPIGLQTYVRRKEAIGKRAATLLEAGKRLAAKLNLNPGTRPKGRKQKKDYNKYRAAVFLLEEDFKKLEKSYNRGIGPRLVEIVWSWTQLILGILGIIISLVWFIHIILFVVIKPSPHPFLNQFFIALDDVFGLFGTIAYGLFSFYLLWCVIKGNFKFGLRVPFLFSIHPMKVGETMVNSFLFNTLLLLLASTTLVQFCSSAFSLYNRFTGIDILFNIGTRNLLGIKYIWRYYFWGLVVLPVLTLIYLCVFPSDRKQAEKGVLSEDLP